MREKHIHKKRVFLNPLEHPICFVKPRRLTRFSAWIKHIPRVMLVVDFLFHNDSFVEVCPLLIQRIRSRELNLFML